MLRGALAAALTPLRNEGASLDLDAIGPYTDFLADAGLDGVFVLFFSFALNMALQYGRRGPWRDYLFAERSYLVLSLVAKSLLAWQVYAGALAG